MESVLKSKVSIKSENEQLEKVLTRLFSGVKISYKIAGKSIALNIEKKTGTKKAENADSKVSGLIIDSKGLPVIGAVISVKGGNEYVVAGNDGSYSINASEEDVLVANSVGYKTAEFPVVGRSVVDMTLEEDVQMLDDVVVTGYQRDPDIKAIGDRFAAKMNEIVLPGDVQWKIGGSSELLTSSLDSLVKVLLIAIYLVYVVMVVQFERFIQPFIILGSIPFVVIGVALTLFLTNTQISLVSMLGIIALAGTVVNNAIVLVDFTNLLRRDYNMELMDAVYKGAASRFKPIMMTTLTTILGVIPMAFGGGEGAEIYAPLGLTIGSGLITSTAVTLFIIPMLYATVEKRMENRKQKKKIAISGEASK